MATAERTERPAKGCYLTTMELHRLDIAVQPLLALDSHGVMLVGSVSERPDFRDVDVRLILGDEEFDQLFGHSPELWSVFCYSVSRMLAADSGLPVDFQVQRMTEANEKYGGRPRNPLGSRARHAMFAGRGDATRWTRRHLEVAPEPVPEPARPQVDPQPVDMSGKYPCGIGDCREVLDSGYSRGQHRRRQHPGWNTVASRPASSGPDRTWVNADGTTQQAVPATAEVPSSAASSTLDTLDFHEVSVVTEPPHPSWTVTKVTTPPPAPRPAVDMCECGHAPRMHEKDEATDSGRGNCFHRGCGCSELRIAT